MKREFSLALLIAASAFAQQTAQQPSPAAAKDQQPQPTNAAPTSRTAFVRRFSIGGRVSFLALSDIPGGTSTVNLEAGPTQIDSTNEGKSKRLGGGIAMQVAISDRHAISVDIMRRSMGYYLTRQTYVGTDNPNTTLVDERTITGTKENTRASAWEIPVLFRRYNVSRFSEGRRWFWEAGGSVRRTGGVATFIEQDNTACCLQTPARLGHRYAPGVTIGAGAQFNDDYGVRVIPEFRYTRWLSRGFDTSPARSRTNQIELLLGVTF